MGNEIFGFKVGTFSCRAIRDMDEWDRNVLLINTGQHQVLIETGHGDGTSPPGRLRDRLRAAGISPSEIDVVILSHADWDHIGGAVDTSGAIAFPSARYIVARAEWDFWSSPTQRTSPKFLEGEGEEWFQLLEMMPRTRLAQLHDKLELVESKTEIVPGIRAIAAPGHTPGMMVVAVSSGADQLLFIADVIYPEDLNNDQTDDPKAIGNLEWHAAVDVDPAQAVATRDWLFEQAARERTLLMAYHLPFPGLGYVAQHSPSWRWQAFENTN